MTDDATAGLLDRIWITHKARIKAEARFRTYNATAHVMTAYYSLWLILVSVLAEPLANRVSYFDKISLALSIVVFALSLSLYGFRFSDRANLHRECYLKLQRLSMSKLSYPELGLAYVDILEGFPNHANRDYEDLVMEKGFFGDDPIKSPATKMPVRPSKTIIVKFFIRKAAFWLSVSAVALTPVTWLIHVLTC